MQRRDFLKLSATAGAVSCVTGCASLNIGGSTAASSPEKVDWIGCTCNCGHACPVKVISQDGRMIRVETDDTGDDSWQQHQSRACAKGRSFRQKVYSPDRLLYPMKRVGKRGEGKFEQISWDEAYDTIAKELKRVIDTYGNQAVYPNYGTGRLYSCFSGGHWTKAGQWGGKLLNTMGGFLGHYNTYSSGQAYNAGIFTYGGRPSSGKSEIANSDLYLSFGYNPAETEMSGSGGVYAMKRMAAGVKSYYIDPRYSDTIAAHDGIWLPIRPGTDAALCEALAYEIISAGRADEAFLNKYCIGYDQSTLPKSAKPGSDFKSHILGKQDGVPKTADYAAEITGIPADSIKQLARELMDAKAPFVDQGLGVQRHAAGEQSVRAIVMLPLLLGKVGQPGTNTGFNSAINVYPWFFSPTGDNPVAAQIPCYSWTEAVLRGADMTADKDGIRGADKLNSNIRFIWNYAGNALINQHGDINRTHEILQDESLCEFILVHDVAMTPSAKYADILLPDLTDAEVTDIVGNPGTEVGALIAVTSSLTPPAQVKGCFEVCLELAKRLGVEQQFAEGKNYQQWMDHLYAEVAQKNGYPDYATLKAKGVHHLQDFSPLIGVKSFIDDPEANPLGTPSGKIEIYSERLQAMEDNWTFADSWSLAGYENVPAVPKYVKTKEGPSDRQTMQQYPLQLIGHHTKGRTHSSFHNHSWLREAVEDAVWINPIDAESRGIKQGDLVLVRSLRGEVKVRARITPRIMPGVTSLPQGAWYQAKTAKGIDEGGCVNTLTSLRPTALGKCNPQHTNLVEIALA